MKMNQVIVQRRKALGLTQEQVAQYLNVSTPAVSKWETGATSPDIALMETVNRVQMLLLKLLDAEWAAGEHQRAGQIAQKTREMANLMDLWAYNAYVAPLQIAAAEKDAQACVTLLKSLLDAMLTQWKREDSPLFCRIPPSAGGMGAKQMLRALLTLMERDPACDFLRTREDFKAFMEAYWQRAEGVPDGCEKNNGCFAGVRYL